MNKTSIFITVFILTHTSFYSQSEYDKDILVNDLSVNSEKILEVFNSGFFTEGPAVGSNGEVYFTDLTFISETGNIPGHIWKYSPLTNETKIYRSPSGMANGLVIDEEDNLYTCEGADTGGRRIIKTNLKSAMSIILADKYKGKLFNSPNDLTRSDDGTIYFTDPRYVGDEAIEQPVNGVYKLLPNGNVELVIDDIPMPNGIAVNRENTKLYIGCNGEVESNNEKLKQGNFIAEYIINDLGKVTFNKYIAKFTLPTGPDGIKLGKDGNVYAAIRDEDKPGVYIYSTNGELLKNVIIPKVPSNLTFSKEDKSILYVTAGGSLYKIFLDQI